MYEGGKSRRFSNFRSVLERKLQMLDAAVSLRDLLAPPNNRLEALSRDRAGQHSIRVNDQFRLCFVWTEQGPSNVECVDYHRETRQLPAMKNNMRPIHPGEILREEFLAPMDMSANRLAKVLEVPTNRITEIVGERRAITAETALRLSRALDTTPEFWLNLQQAYELRTAEKAIGRALKSIKPVKKTG